MAATRDERASILLVEDEYSFGKVTALVLSREGHNVAVASNGAEALRILSAGLRVDLVITDDVMPELGGIAMVEAMEGDPELSQVDVILLASRGRAFPSLPSSVVAILRKPFAVNDLLFEVRAALAKNER